MPPEDHKQQLVDRFYPSDILTPLSERYEFDPTNEQIQHFLSKAIKAVTREEKPLELRSVTKADRKHLQNALASLEKMESSLRNVSSPWGYTDINDALSRHIEGAELRYKNPLKTILLERDYIETSVEILRKMLEANLMGRELKAGRPQNKALQEAVYYLHLIWTDLLSNPFTLDYHKGTALTPSFEFIRDMLSPLIITTDAEIMTAMRYIIAENNTHKI